MTKTEWLWVARYLLVVGGSFLAGYATYGRLHPLATYAAQPEDCESAGMVATGWEVQQRYKGGIKNGGASSMIAYECK